VETERVTAFRASLCVAVAALIALASASPAFASHDQFCNAETPANPAGSANVWSHPDCLSPGEGDGEVPQVGIAETGTALAVWRFKDEAGTERVQAAIRTRGGGFQPVPSPGGFISEANRRVGSYIRLKMNKRGDAIVVWEAFEDNDATKTSDDRIEIRSAYKPFDGGFEPEQVVENSTLGRATPPNFSEPEVGIDGDGDATVLYSINASTLTSKTSILTSKTRPGGRAKTWDAGSKELFDHEFGDEFNRIGYDETLPSLGVDEEGNRLATFTSQKTKNGNVEERKLYEVVRAAGASSWSVDDESGFGSDPYHSTQAVRKDGNSLTGHAQGNLVRAAKNGFGPFVLNTQSVPNPARGTTAVSGAAFELEPDGQGLALWSTGQLLHGEYSKTTSNFFGDDSQPDRNPIPGNGANDRTRPALAAYAEDSAVAVFQEKIGSDETIQAAVRPPGGTTNFDAPVKLAPTIEGQANDVEGEGDTSGAPFAPKKGTGPKVVANSRGGGGGASSRPRRT